MAQEFGCQVGYMATTGLSGLEALGLTMVLGGLVAAGVLIGRIAASHLARPDAPAAAPWSVQI